MNGKTIVLDNGSSICRAGFAGESMPRSIIPSVVARVRKSIDIYGVCSDIYIGNNVYWKAGILSLKYPIEYGVVTNWEDMEKIFNFQFFHDLKVQTDEHGVLLTESVPINKLNRKKLVELMFELYNVPSFYIESQSVLSMLASKSLTGLSFTSGEGLTQVVPVYEGYKIPHAIKTSKIAGKVLNDFLNHQLRERGHLFDSPSEKEIIRNMKEKYCYVSLDYNNEISRIKSNRFYLPDGNQLYFSKEQIKCPELLFNPELYKAEESSVNKLIIDSINSCDFELQEFLYQHIFISGGTTMFKGFKERLENEINEKLSFEVKLIKPFEDCINCAWEGGSLLASLDSFNYSLISRDDYSESGTGIVHCKCL